MNIEGGIASTDYQFGPVNKYHLTGSIKTRMGVIEPQDPGYGFLEKNNYEWKEYSLDAFSTDWKLSDFNY